MHPWTFGPLLKPGDLPSNVVFIIGMILIACLFAIDMASGPLVRLPVLYIFPLAAIAFHVPERNRVVGSLAVTMVLQGLVLYSYNFGALPTFGAFLTAAASTLLVGALARAARSNYLQAMELASLDALTGIHNVRSFHLLIDLEIKRQNRYGGVFSLAMLDLDHFKELNDKKGHAAGDRALSLVADILRSHTRAADMIGRIGGDEFIIFMPNTGKQDCAALCRHLVANIASGMKEHSLAVTASMGSTTFDDPPESVAIAVALADEAMFLAKAAGKNCAVSR